MIRIALDIPSASRRLALRRWLEARGHEVVDTDPDLMLTDDAADQGPASRIVPGADGPGAGRIDFDRLDRVLAEFDAHRHQVVELDGPMDAGLVTHSPAMRELSEKIDRLAAVDLPVLITGESGSGKEIVARELHRRGPRQAEPFVAINCAAIPEGLFESELFGHERGSFTDAGQQRRGHFETAGAGTLFLDEIGELPATVQAKLLRALQDRRFYRVGAERPMEFRARVLSATALDLEHDPRFRADLYHRIAGTRLHVPPLRERPEDIPDLCRLILGRTRDHPVTAIDTAVLDRLSALEWPGNVRQLENLLGQAAIFSPGPVLELGALEPVLARVRPSDGNWFHEALRVWVTARKAAGHSPAELREELLDRLAAVEESTERDPNQAGNPKEMGS